MNHASIQTLPCGEVIHINMQSLNQCIFNIKLITQKKGSGFTSSIIKIASIITLEQIPYLVDDRSFNQTDPNKEFENYV